MARSSDDDVRAGLDSLSNDELAAVAISAAVAYRTRDRATLERIREDAADAGRGRR